MTTEEAKELINNNRQANIVAMNELIPVARAAVDALKDAGKLATANSLEAKLFTVDALDQELREKVLQYPLAFLQAVAASLGR
jgi:hypothetical protein